MGVSVFMPIDAAFVTHHTFVGRLALQLHQLAFAVKLAHGEGGCSLK